MIVKSLIIQLIFLRALALRDVNTLSCYFTTQATQNPLEFVNLKKFATYICNFTIHRL